ncbi:Protein of unknown function [Escherichia coli D6-113.11]|nr:Protein of unknown function [Escherichia coli D6-113.11]CDU34824.1 Protein of unknown function [Escherichia coli D6-113.11]
MVIYGLVCPLTIETRD